MHIYIARISHIYIIFLFMLHECHAFLKYPLPYDLQILVIFHSVALKNNKARLPNYLLQLPYPSNISLMIV